MKKAIFVLLFAMMVVGFGMEAYAAMPPEGKSEKFKTQADADYAKGNHMNAFGYDGIGGNMDHESIRARIEPGKIIWIDIEKFENEDEEYNIVKLFLDAVEKKEGYTIKSIKSRIDSMMELSNGGVIIFLEKNEQTTRSITWFPKTGHTLTYRVTSVNSEGKTILKTSVITYHEIWLK